MADPEKGPLKGSYLLLMELTSDRTISVGALGAWRFRPGTYLYCGSAMNGFRHRLGRHFSKEKVLRWHIDYFLQEAEPFGALIFPEGKITECQLRSALSRSDLVKIPVKGFGSSDCSCPGHLLYLEEDSRLTAIIIALQEILILCS